MAAEYTRLSQALLRPTLRADDEEIDDAIPLIHLSQRNIDFSLHDNSSGQYQTNSQEEIGVKDTIASHTRNTKIATTNDAASKTSQHWAFPKPPRLTSKLSHAWDLRVRRSRFHGWRMGVLLGCCMSFFVLCCNIALIAIGANSKTGYDDEGLSTIIEGDEDRASRWNTALHVLINTLSTMLLSSSNYTMQVLNSPTRKDLDVAHAKEEWLDIGRLSIRNLRAIPPSRTMLCLVLVLSSTPLHMFYNASVFKVVTNRESYVIRTMDVASEDWKRISTRTDNSTWTQGDYWALSAHQWATPYSKEHNSVHGDLYLAIDMVAINLTSFTLNPNSTQFEPINVTTVSVGGSSTVKSLVKESLEWLDYSSIVQPYNYNPSVVLPENYTPSWERHAAVSLHVVKAASKKESGTPSTVQISKRFLILVACFNLIKLVVMLSVLVADRSAYLVTLGDAASSFLERRDRYTMVKCLLSREGMLKRKDLPKLGRNQNNLSHDKQEIEQLHLRLKGAWLPYSRSYFSPFHKTALKSYVYLSVLSVVIFAGALAGALVSRSAWGTSSSSYMNPAVGQDVATLWSAWLSNVPQLILSFCYFWINLVCTAMAASEEWNNLGISRKGLRVTQPYGHQRSTYFLQLPYRWSLPLIIISGTLHWLLSQTFFLVRTETLSFVLPVNNETGIVVPLNDTRPPDLNKESRAAIGFSALSLMVLLGVLFLLLGVIGAMGLQKRQVRVPVVASCSLAISAACHPPPGDINAHLAKVRWGVTENEVVTGFRHCSLSSKAVTEPEEGRTYY